MFAELRPKHCILATASGTHAVCVCVHNTSNCKIDGVCDAAAISINIPPLLSEEHVQSTTAWMLPRWVMCALVLHILS